LTQEGRQPEAKESERKAGSDLVGQRDLSEEGEKQGQERAANGSGEEAEQGGAGFDKMSGVAAIRNPAIKRMGLMAERSMEVYQFLISKAGRALRDLE
jgi:hypothetical protein